MRLNIAICDDNINHLNIVIAYLKSFKCKYEIFMIKACSGEELLNLIKEQPVDIAILDIEMNGIDGIQVGRKIRAKFPEAIIVFITGYGEYALEAYKLEAFQYITKPITEKAFYKLIERAVLRFEERKIYLEKKMFYTFKTRQQIISIAYEDIYYFEKQGKKTIVMTTKDGYEFNNPLKQIINDLNSNQFLRCHNSFIVNRDKIREVIGSDIIFRNIKKSIPISRRYKTYIMDILEKNLFQE